MSIAQRLSAAGFSPSVRRVLSHSVFVGLALSSTDILLPFYLVSLSYSTAEVGLFSTMSRFAGMLTAIPLGSLSDRIGAQRALILGLGSWGAAYMLLLLAPNLILMLIAQFLIGCCLFLIFGTVTPLMASLVEDSHRSQIFAVNEFMYVFLGLIGAAMGGLLPGLIAGANAWQSGSPQVYRLALLVCSSLMFIGLVPLLARLNGPRHAGGGSAGQNTVQRLLPQRRLMRISLSSLFFGLGAGALLPFQGLFLRETFSLTDSSVGLIISSASLAGGVGALVSPLIVQRLGTKRAAALLRMSLGGAIALLTIPFLPMVVFAFMLRSCFFSACVPSGQTLMIGLTPPQQRGRLMSLTSLFWATGWAASSLANGWLVPQVGYVPGFLAAAVFLVCSGLSFATLREYTPPDVRL